MKFKTQYALCLLALIPILSQAVQLPIYSQDSRVQTFNYEPGNVYQLKTMPGAASAIELEEGETVAEAGALGVGNADHFSIGVSGRHVFFKPLIDEPATNMILVTNKRTYVFDILSTKTRDVTYLARFLYPTPPEPAPAPAPQEPLPPLVALSHKDALGNDIYLDYKYNKNYAYRGALHLKPTHAFDDGRFTYLEFDHGGDMPVVYRVLEDNTDLLVNSHIEDNTLVLHETAGRYRLRLGNAVGEVNNQFYRLPAFNTQGATGNFVRIHVEGQ